MRRRPCVVDRELEPQPPTSHERQDRLGLLGGRLPAGSIYMNEFVRVFAAHRFTGGLRLSTRMKWSVPLRRILSSRTGPQPSDQHVTIGFAPKWFGAPIW